MNLGEARNPSYLETDKGCVALISSASTFSNFGRAGESRRDIQGRPGLNPLRYHTEIRITNEALQKIKSISESVNAKIAIGPITNKSVVFGKRVGGRFDYVSDRSLDGVRFVESEKPGLFTKPYEPDLQDIIRSIKDARRQADLVILSHHGHEEDGSDRYMPAKFIETYARACIDAGADLFLGHGPHVLRGIEIYKDKPIIYSLGNFLFQIGIMNIQGQDYYDRFHLGNEATYADAYDASNREGKKDWRGWHAFAYEKTNWDSIVAIITFDGRKLENLKLHPATLGFELQRSQRGRPIRASPEDSIRIIDFISKYSSSYGTQIEIENGIGDVVL